MQNDFLRFLPNNDGEDGVEHEASVPEELRRLLDPPLQEVSRGLLLIIFGNGRRRFRKVPQSGQCHLQDKLA